jgi:hypothetical protein
MAEAACGPGLAQPRPAHLEEDLTSLLSPAFRARVGCYRQAVVAGLYVASVPGAAAGLVDLFVLLFPRSQFAPDSSVEQQITNVSLDFCLKLLRHARPALRTSACQRLGLLGCGEASEALLEAARGDSDEGVREAAADALERLTVQLLPAGALSNIELALFSQSPSGNTELGKARTDDRGCVRFTGVPEEASCCLQMVGSDGGAPATPKQVSGPAPSYQSLGFSHDCLSQGRLGHFAVEITPIWRGAEPCFDAVLRFCSHEPGGKTPLELPYRPVARQGQHLYHPTSAWAAEGAVTFGGLPTGKYDLLWLVQPPTVARDSRLLAKSTTSASLRRLSLDAYLQVVVHPADRRLLATVEPDHGGSLVLTVAGDAAELQGATVQYSLLGESGVIRLADVNGTGIYRGVRYLRQRFAPESALALNLEVSNHEAHEN